MNPFEYMINDIFNVKDFVEYFTYDGKQIKCVSYHIDTDPNINVFGYDENTSFYITCKASDYTPEKNHHITFRNQLYKVDSF